MITEKSHALEKISETNKKAINVIKYTLKVHPDANKSMVKNALKKIYQVTPSSINMLVNRGKVKKFRNVPFTRPHWKKAIVTFRDGTKLEFSKGV